MQTFSQIVQDVTASVREQAKRAGFPGHFSSALITRHARGALTADGSPDAPASLVGPVVEAVRDMLAADAAGHGGA